MNKFSSIYLSGYYPPSIDPYGSVENWEKEWSMGPHADSGWVWFNGYYTEKSIRKILANPGDAGKEKSE